MVEALTPRDAESDGISRLIGGPRGVVLDDTYVIDAVDEPPNSPAIPSMPESTDPAGQE
ncbi:hypothetical protein ACIBCH_37285 [Amycolatopsis thailandensis]|uniref:hypothetical protein n=1 Tax=Amycolatopsis thailandensis TaxID=589330 RepID=UPI0037930BF3